MPQASASASSHLLSRRRVALAIPLLGSALWAATAKASTPVLRTQRPVVGTAVDIVVEGADAQQLQIHAAGLLDFIVVVRRHLVRHANAAGHVRAGLVNIHQVEQVAVHEVAVALMMASIQTHLLIQIDALHFTEIYLTLLIECDEFLVHAFWAGTGGQS